MVGFTRRAAILGTAVLARPALGQGAWPDRPLRILVPYSAGGVADTIMRTLQPKLAEHLGQPVVVENRTDRKSVV